jgi:hypothetical protein
LCYAKALRIEFAVEFGRRASLGLAQRLRASAKRRRFVGAPRMATRFLSAEFQGRDARVAANYPLGRACERSGQRSRRTRFVTL